jgi:hypothetical protein
MKDPLVAAGLRALREEAPSDESRRATLARLGLADTAASTQAQPRSTHGVLPWLLVGVLAGVLALVLQRWLASGG